MTMLSEPALTAARTQARRTLIAGVALGSTGHIAAVTIATIAAAELTDQAALVGAPGAAVVVGAALGAALLGWIASRWGRRPALTTGYLLGVAGAAVATIAVLTTSFWLFIIGTFLIGFGNASNQASRYAAADLVSPERRASAIGTVVWAATVGAVVGPNLVPLAGGFVASLGLPELAGPYLVPVVFVGAAALLTHVYLRPDPFEIADASSRDHPDAAPPDAIRSIIRRPVVVAALVALVAGQFVMTLIMTMTPLHMKSHGHGLDTVGLVISAHTLGMFALSPISGRLTDRFRPVPVIFLGTAVLALSGLMTAFAPPTEDRILFVAMFLLGWGWNLGFVAGSSLLTSAVSPGERARTQGFTDALIWSSAAIASAGSGVVVATAGFATLGILGVAIVAVPVIVLTTGRRRIGSTNQAGDPTVLAEEIDVVSEI